LPYLDYDREEIWSRLSIRIAGALFLVGVATVWVRDSESVALDSCLDHGGCWDRISHVCRLNEPDAISLCMRSDPAGDAGQLSQP
jgi:hypothetical protein